MTLREGKEIYSYHAKAKGEVKGKCADADIQLDVDQMMLDYLLYMSTKALLEERIGPRDGNLTEPPPELLTGINTCKQSSSDLLLGMVDAFLPIFKSHHPTYVPSISLQCRLHLLKYTSLFVRRLYPSPAAPSLASLKERRRYNRDRAAKWLRHRAELSHSDPLPLTVFSSALPLSEANLLRNRQQVLSMRELSNDNPFHGTPSSPTLLDGFPIFMALSSTVAPNASITPAWMVIAGELMLQASLEQYLVYGAQGPEALTEAFAWGYDALENVVDGEQGSINAMFWDELGDQNPIVGEIEAWTSLRDDHMRALIPDPGVDLATHLSDVSARFPLNGFEHKILNFLQASWASQPLPILTQLEMGKLKGLSREETEALGRRVGIF